MKLGTRAIRFSAPVFLVLQAGLGLFSVHAEEGSVQPYIDRLKQEMEPAPKDESEGGSYTEQLKKKLGSEPTLDRVSPNGYIDQLRKDDPSLNPKPPSGSFTEQQKSKLGPPSQDSAIQAYKEGRSQLHPRKEGEISQAFGFRIGAAVTRDLTSNSDPTSGGTFTSLYGTGWKPDLNLFYEYQPWHSEFWGNLGILANLGATYFSGNGKFAVPISTPTGLASESRTKFRFLAVPASLGLIYRFNMAKYIRPFVHASPSLIGFIEYRDDGKGDHRGLSRGAYYGAGVAILLDFLTPRNAWELYEEASIKQYFLTVDYTRLSTIGGDVRYNASGLSVGLTYEF